MRDTVADVRDLHADPAHAGAVFPVASQFNLLEMANFDATPDMGIARFAQDHTEGPACAISCATGTIYRNCLVPLRGEVGQTAARQIDTPADLGAALGNGGDALWSMRNGYLLPRPGALARIAARIGHVSAALRGLLRVGVQADTAVTLPGVGHCVTQVYASALPISHSINPSKRGSPLPGWCWRPPMKPCWPSPMTAPGPPASGPCP